MARSDEGLTDLSSSIHDKTKIHHCHGQIDRPRCQRDVCIGLSVLCPANEQCELDRGKREDSYLCCDIIQAF